MLKNMIFANKADNLQPKVILSVISIERFQLRPLRRTHTAPTSLYVLLISLKVREASETTEAVH
jgi:hypothetical protein